MDDLLRIVEEALGRQVEGIAAEDLPALREHALCLAAEVAAYAVLASRTDIDPRLIQAARGDVVTSIARLHLFVEEAAKRRGIAFARELAGAVVTGAIAALWR